MPSSVLRFGAQSKKISLQSRNPYTCVSISIEKKVFKVSLAAIPNIPQRVIPSPFRGEEERRILFSKLINEGRDCNYLQGKAINR